jgi:transposase
MGMHLIKYVVGIDMSKDKFHVCLSLINTVQKVTVKASTHFANTPAGFSLLLRWVAKHCKEKIPVVYVMEATGVYHEQLAWYLHQQGCQVSVVLPTKAKRYLQSVGFKSKNDKMDAQGLAQMGCEQSLALWQPLSPHLYELRSLTRLQESLQAQKTILTNQLEAFTLQMHPSKQAMESVRQLVKAMDKELVKLQKQIHALIEQDPLLKDKCEKLTSVPGIGVHTFAVIVSETNGFALIENQAQLVSYAGYDVVEQQSGQQQGKTKISKKGNAHIRRAMYMPALSVIRYQKTAYWPLYQRICERTGIKMKGCVAVQKKLLCLLYALWKKDQSYQSNPKDTSRDSEPKSLFPVVFEENPLPTNTPDAASKPNEVAPTSRATQDELRATPRLKLPFW